MQVALNGINNQSIDLISLFKDFLQSVVDNYKFKHKTYELEKRIKNISNNILFFNDNLEKLVTYKNYDSLENELIELQSLLENSLDENLPQNLKKELNNLYENIVMLNFNSSMLDMRKEIENIRN